MAITLNRRKMSELSFQSWDEMFVPILGRRKFSSTLKKKTDKASKKAGFLPPNQKLTSITMNSNLGPLAEIRRSIRKTCPSKATSANEHLTSQIVYADSERFQLPMDMNVPGPDAYYPICKPPGEAASPSFSFGKRCAPEKAGGGRTAWTKTWFHTPHIWLHKVNFLADRDWPEPTSYQLPTFIQKPYVSPTAPSYTMGKKLPTVFGKKDAAKEPAPNSYSFEGAERVVYSSPRVYSHQFRNNGTLLWFEKEKTPGPGRYNPELKFNRPSGPKYSIKTRPKLQSNHYLGPFATFAS